MASPDRLSWRSKTRIGPMRRHSISSVISVAALRPLTRWSSSPTGTMKWDRATRFAKSWAILRQHRRCIDSAFPRFLPRPWPHLCEGKRHRPRRALFPDSGKSVLRHVGPCRRWRHPTDGAGRAFGSYLPAVDQRLGRTRSRGRHRPYDRNRSPQPGGGTRRSKVSMPAWSAASWSSADRCSPFVTSSCERQS